MFLNSLNRLPTQRSETLGVFHHNYASPNAMGVSRSTPSVASPSRKGSSNQVLRISERTRIYLFSDPTRCDIPQQTSHSNRKRTSLKKHPMPNTTTSIRSTQTQDGRILLDIQQGKLFSVNAVGSTILGLIESGWDEPRITAEISRAYQIAVEVIREDVHEFIRSLHQHHILAPDVLSVPHQR